MELFGEVGPVGVLCACQGGREPARAVPTTDPKALLALWLLATVDGIGSARRLARLCQEHDAYRWMRGNVPVNYHMLSDFRVVHQEALDGLLTQIIGSLMAAGAVRLERVAQDGMRVRASAGAASFRGEGGIEDVSGEGAGTGGAAGAGAGAPRPRCDAAGTRGAGARGARAGGNGSGRRCRTYPGHKRRRKRQLHTKATDQRPKVTKARVSTTDPQATVMKMPDGGFRPACNVELATDCANGIIVGVAVASAGTDAGQAAPMEEQLVRRTGRHPESYLIGRGLRYPGGPSLLWSNEE